MIDGHIHIMETEEFRTGQGKALAGRLEEAGCRGGVVLSLPPKAFAGDSALSAEERIERILALGAEDGRLLPFFWIDPLDSDAPAQVARAADAGILGFKVICVDADPGASPSLSVYQKIADRGLPILFHSGILWNSKDSSRYCRPANFECLLGVEGLRFALAHVGWPWYDECLAVFGKFLQTKEMGLDQQMYIDLTPGTPEIYRREVLTKLFTIGYAVEDSVFFGSDCHGERYDIAWTKRWRDIDRGIYKELSLDAAQIEKIEEKNLLAFLGRPDL